MHRRPVEDALARVHGGNVEVEAPEWANGDGWTLGARAAAAALLLGLVVAVLFNVNDRLPGEKANERVRAVFTTRATEVSDQASAALSARIEAGDEARASKEALKQAKAEGAPESVLKPLRNARVSDAGALAESVREHERLVVLRADALDDVLEFAPPPEPDIVRAVGVGVLTLASLLGAAVLLAPRSTQLLKVRRIFAPQPLAGTTSQPGAGGAGGAGGTPPGGSSPAPSQGGTSGGTSGTGITQKEPAWTQGILAAVALAAGLFGIQELEGNAEKALNVALPVIPLIGAWFTRSRVVARPNLSPEERARLFDS